MSTTTKFTVIDSDSGPVSNVSDLLLGSDSSVMCSLASGYFMALASKARTGTVDIEVLDTVGTYATGTFTIASPTATAVVGGVTCASVHAGDTVTISNSGPAIVTLTAVSGTPGANQFDMSGSNSQCATSLKAAFEANTVAAALFTVGILSNAITLTGKKTGTSNNTLVLNCSNLTRLPLVPFAAGAADTAYFNNGGLLSATNVAPENYEFLIGANDTETAANLASAINLATDAQIADLMTATSNDAVVTVSAWQPGALGNLLFIDSSNGSTIAVTAMGGGTNDSGAIHTYNCG